MAIDGIYDIGTISVNAGATAVTGVGTAWTTVGITAGDKFEAGGLIGLVESVTDNTHLTLTRAWPGASNLSGVGYQIIEDSWLRNAISTAQRQIGRIVNILNGTGYIYPVAAGGTPDNSLGEDNQYALDLTNLLLWKKVGGVWTGPTSIGAVINADYLVKTANAGLSAERVVTDNNVAGGIVWDWATAGQVKAKDYFSGANKYKYSTGANSAAEGDITSAGRALINSTVTADGSGYVSGATGLDFTGLSPQISKSSSARLDFSNVGGLDANNPFWLGCHWAAPSTITVSGSPVYPRMAMYWNYATTADPVNLTYNIIIYGGGVDAALEIGTDSPAPIYLRTNNVRRATIDGSTGSFDVVGAFSAGSKAFLIDHPLDPLNKDLKHGFVESPRYDLEYRGRVTLADGQATVDIDAASRLTAGTFAALTQNADVVSLCNRSGFARVRASEIVGGTFTIFCEDTNSADDITWVVLAERHDPFIINDEGSWTDQDGRLMPERDKPDYQEV